MRYRFDLIQKDMHYLHIFPILFITATKILSLHNKKKRNREKNSAIALEILKNRFKINITVRRLIGIFNEV
jgi:hypothetical protein